MHCFRFSLYVFFNMDSGYLDDDDDDDDDVDKVDHDYIIITMMMMMLMMITAPNVLHMALLDIMITKILINGINQPTCEKWICPSL